MTSSNHLLKFLCLLICTSLLLQSCTTGLGKGLYHYERGEYDQAAASWKPLAERGYAKAHYNMALLSEYGHGSTALDKTHALALYLLAADKNYPPAMFKIANLKSESDEDEQAMSWLVLAARWYHKPARKKLKELGQRVPSPDLFALDRSSNKPGADNMICKSGDRHFICGRQKKEIARKPADTL